MLKHDIGVNAGIIWNLLHEKGALNARNIKKHKKPHRSYNYITPKL